MRFFLSALGVVGAGILIGRLAGEIGERLKLGRAWAGAVLLAFATTLPELVATVSVALRGEVGLAVGGILGSIVFNLTILVFVDFIANKPFYTRVSTHHLSTGWLGVALLLVLFVAFGVRLAGVEALHGLSVGHVGVWPLGLLAIYGVGQYRLLSHARSLYSQEDPAQVTAWRGFSLSRLLLTFALISGVIMVSAYHLGIAAEGLAEAYGLGKTFAGATLLGIVTSLPELTNGLICAKHREFDLAIGNVLGANAFVFLVLVVADGCQLAGPILPMMSDIEVASSAVMVGVAIVMQGIVISAIAWRSRLRVGRLHLVSLLLAALYAVSLAVTAGFRGS